MYLAVTIVILGLKLKNYLNDLLNKVDLLNVDEMCQMKTDGSVQLIHYFDNGSVQRNLLRPKNLQKMQALRCPQFV